METIKAGIKLDKDLEVDLAFCELEYCLELLQSSKEFCDGRKFPTITQPRAKPLNAVNVKLVEEELLESYDLALKFPIPFNIASVYTFLIISRQ